MNSPAIGIITALPKEFAAVRHMLENCDERNVPGPGAGRRYLLGTIPSIHGGCHSIVLCLAEMGNNIAASRATLLLEHFPTIESVIMTGIAGGVPHHTVPALHVRLGDIVVSNWKGVIQYDMKELEEINCSPRPPNALLLEAVRLLDANSLSNIFPWEPHLKAAMKSLGWRKPSQTRDQLFSSGAPETEIEHPKDPQRRGVNPRVFAGVIASSNELLKDPRRRDSLRDKHGARAVEMETSGIADASWYAGIGYLGVRGICDYCDSHKNYEWQEYAAVVSAAYTRALIESMPVRYVGQLVRNEAPHKEKVVIESFWSVVGTFWARFRLLLYTMNQIKEFSPEIRTIFGLCVGVMDGSVDVDSIDKKTIENVFRTNSFDGPSRAVANSNGGISVCFDPEEALSGSPISCAKWFFAEVKAVELGCDRLLVRFGSRSCEEAIECIALMHNRADFLSHLADRLTFESLKESDISCLWSFFERAILSAQLVERFREGSKDRGIVQTQSTQTTGEDKRKDRRAAADLWHLVSTRMHLFDEFFRLMDIPTLNEISIATHGSNYQLKELSERLVEQVDAFRSEHLSRESNTSIDTRALSWEELFCREFTELNRGCEHLLARHSERDEELLNSVRYLANWSRIAALSLSAHLSGMFEAHGSGPDIPEGCQETFRAALQGIVLCHHAVLRVNPPERN